MYIILIRHAKSLKNQGQDRPEGVRNYDIPLVPGIGHEQAEDLGAQLGRWLKEKHIHESYVLLVNSFYERARRTTEHMAIGSDEFLFSRCKHKESALIAEVDHGPAEDLPEDDKNHPDIMEAYAKYDAARTDRKTQQKDIFKVAYPWGEGRKDVMKRCKKFLKEELANAKETNAEVLIVVSHASVSHDLQKLACGHKKKWLMETMPVTYGGITVLEGNKLGEFEELPQKELKAAFPGHHLRRSKIKPILDDDDKSFHQTR